VVFGTFADADTVASAVDTLAADEIELVVGRTAVVD